MKGKKARTNDYYIKSLKDYEWIMSYKENTFDSLK